MLSRNDTTEKRQDQGHSYGRRRPAGGFSTICLGDYEDPNRYQTSAGNPRRNSHVEAPQTADDRIYPSRRYQQPASSIFTPDDNNPHYMPSLSRGSASLSESRPVSHSTQSIASIRDERANAEVADMEYMYSSSMSIPSTPGMDRQRPSFLQDTSSNPSSMKDVFSYEIDETQSPVARMKERRRDSARSSSSFENYQSQAMENKKRNTLSNVFDQTPVAVAQRPVRQYVKSQVFQSEPLEHKVTRKYEYSDIFHMKNAAEESYPTSRRGSNKGHSQIVFG